MRFIGKLLKFIFKTILWLVIIVLILGIVLYLSAGKLIQYVAPVVISQVTQTESSLGEVDISLLSGRIGLNKLVIENPVGYKNRNAFELGKFEVQFDPKSVITKKIIINNVQISGLNVSSEAKANGETNISRLMDNVNQSLGQGTKKAPEQKAAAPAKAPTEKAGDPISVVIKDLRVDDSSVNVALSGIPGLNDAAVGTSVPLPNIHLQNIGENKKQTPKETVLQVVNTINAEVVKASAKAVQEASKKALQNGKDAINGIANSIKSLF